MVFLPVKQLLLIALTLNYKSLLLLRIHLSLQHKVAEQKSSEISFVREGREYSRFHAEPREPSESESTQQQQQQHQICQGHWRAVPFWSEELGVQSESVCLCAFVFLSALPVHYTTRMGLRRRHTFFHCQTAAAAAAAAKIQRARKANTQRKQKVEKRRTNDGECKARVVGQVKDNSLSFYPLKVTFFHLQAHTKAKS